VAVRALPSALRRVSQVVVRAAIRRPTAARVTPAVAARRTRARRRVVQTARRTGALAQVTRRQAAARRMIVARRGATLRPTLRAPMRRRRPR
jgi:hypothetical protein